MSTEVRTEGGELVGWIDQDFGDRDHLELSGIGIDDFDQPTVQTMVIERQRLFLKPWRVTSGQLEKLRRSSIFRPLITREMMVEAVAAGVAKGWATRVDTSSQAAALAEAVVEEVLADQVEPL